MPNQVKWAQGLRNKRIEELQKLGLRGILLAMKPHVDEAWFERMGCKSQRHILAFARGVLQEMVRHPDARWWIETRELPPYHNFKQHFDRCVEHYAKIKPFK